jgi:hypothetical protein
LRNRTLPRGLAACLVATAAGVSFTALAATSALGATSAHEAESMEFGVRDSIDGTLWPRKISDAAASGGAALHYGPNGSAAKTVTTTAKSTAITIRARGTQCSGAPTAKVSIDGTVVGTFSVSATAWTDYRQTIATPAGTHRIAVAFTNNYYASGCNRDLFLDRFSLTTEDTTTTTPTTTVPTTTTPTTTTPTTTTPTTGKVLWRGDVDAGRSAWNREHMVSASRATAAAIGGRNAWRMQVNDGDNYGGYGERTEFGQDGNSAREFHNGDNIFVGYSVYMPAGFPTNVKWTAFTQMKDQSPDLGSPSWSTNLEQGSIGVKTHIGCTGCFVFKRPATTDTWHNFVIHYKLGTSASTGEIEIWYSTGANKPALVYAAKRQTYRTSSKMVPRVGYYRDKAIGVNAAVYHAGFTVGTSFDAVNPVK